MNQYDFSKLHQKELLEEAERRRMISQLKRRSAVRPHYLAAGLNWWGGKLIRWGYIIQKRFGDPVRGEDTRVMN